MSCGVGHRSGLDLALLWRRPVAIAWIRPLAWEPPYVTGVALEKTKTNKQKKKPPQKTKKPQRSHPQCMEVPKPGI